MTGCGEINCDNGRYCTDNLTIYGEIRDVTNIPDLSGEIKDVSSDRWKKVELRVWLINPNTGDFGQWFGSNQAVVLFANSHGADQGKFNYVVDHNYPNDIRIVDRGDFYDNDGINLDVTIGFESPRIPNRITINTLNAGIGWNYGVNLRIKDLKLAICRRCTSAPVFFFSTNIQRFFGGHCYWIGGTSYNGAHALRGNMGYYYRDTTKDCCER